MEGVSQRVPDFNSFVHQSYEMLRQSMHLLQFLMPFPTVYVIFRSEDIRQ